MKMAKEVVQLWRWEVNPKFCFRISVSLQARVTKFSQSYAVSFPVLEFSVAVWQIHPRLRLVFFLSYQVFPSFKWWKVELERVEWFFIHVWTFFQSLIWGTLTLSHRYLDKLQNCLIVSFTACLTSFIFQQYRNGFRVEFNKSSETVTVPTRPRAVECNPVIRIKAVRVPYGR